MSLIPNIPSQMLEELFAPYNIVVEISERGVLLQSETNGVSYRMALNAEDEVLGTAMLRACRIFELDALAVVFPN